MRDWNIIVTTLPVPASENHVLHALRHFGEFSRSTFRDVCIGKTEEPLRLLELISAARSEGKSWANEIARILPVEQVFRFTPDSLIDQLKETTAGFIDRMVSGKFYVRLERRGMLGKINSPEVERAVADHLVDLAECQGKRLNTDFTDPDYIVLAESIGDECGVALLPRALLEKYPFTHPK